MNVCVRSTIVLFLLALPLHAKDDEAPTFTNARAAGEDFKIQGEYQGTLGNSEWGAQVIATGDGSFRAIGYFGGLPGDGWTGEKGQYLKGKRADGTVKLTAENFYLHVDGETLEVFTKDDDRSLGELQKVTRKSKTLGDKPPAGAIVLFDGSSVDQWNQGKLVKKKFLGATNCSTKEKLGDHTLHIEFRTPFMPASSGQARGNSGVYVQGRYEVQVLDSFGLDGLDNECGGIYKVSKPKLNMCYPPLSWQTYDIAFTSAKWNDAGEKTANARITVRHNDVIIHDNIELPTHTPGRHAEGPAPEALFLQDHGNPVVYRNIWVIKE